jgi:preprotein translocase subunit YajC
MNPEDLFLLALVAGLFALMWNNGRKRKKAAQELQDNLGVGAEVMLSGGIFATIAAVEEDRLTVKSGTSTLVVAKGAIVRVITAAPVAKPAAKKTAAKKPAAKPTKTEK